MCQHQPQCPDATAPDHLAARVMAGHPEQGWSLLCNGVVSFDDTGQILPDGRTVPPRGYGKVVTSGAGPAFHMAA